MIPQMEIAVFMRQVMARLRQPVKPAGEARGLP
jgi:hypothetical protein